MNAIRTTLQLDVGLHTELKTAAARLQTSVRALLEEGARLVLDRARGQRDQETLKARALAARRHLAAGYGESGPKVSFGSDAHDHLAYPAVPEAGEPWATYSSTPGASSRKRIGATRGTQRRPKR